MMLSDEDIKRVIENGELQIRPFSPKWIRSSGITLHLGAELLKPRGGYVVDVRKPEPPPYDQIIITPDKPYQLQPGEFLLAHTFQSVTVGASLGFMIEGRSTLARVGLTIVQTAMMVYPGHSNRPVTLELANHGPNSILLYPKMKIARVGLFELKSPSAIRYDDAGKYRDQQSVGLPIFKNEIMPDDECAES
jgi:dCTP deaminase